MAKAKFKFTTIIQRFLPLAIKQGGLSAHQIAMLKLISICKTAALGGHKERCDQCIFSKVHFNSCGNRNCPNCQGINKEKWIYDRQFDLLPVKYFHAVFTVPEQLRVLFLYNKVSLYKLLSSSAQQTMLQFGKDPRQKMMAKIGGISILHTWNQRLEYHPHLHMIVPAGGVNKKGQWVNSRGKDNFLFHVKALSIVFKSKFMEGVHKLFMNGDLNLPPDWNVNKYYKCKNVLYKLSWNVYAKRAFGGPEQVLEYLARYTHKIAISNYRILAISDTHVTFRYADRKAKKISTRTVTGEEFIKLFARHILPKGFVKIRHFGFLASRVKRKYLSQARKCLNAPTPPPKAKLTSRQFLILTTGKDPYQCPCCEKGEMVVIKIIPAIRGSPCKIPMRFLAADRKVSLS